MSCVNLTADFNAEMDNECVICYEIIGKTNCCVTPCGHHYCFKCLMKSMERNDGCPMCREPLIDPSVSEDEDDDAENDYVYEDSDDESSEADDEDDRVRTHRYLLATQAPPEIVAKRLSDMGYTMSDVIALYTGFINDGKYNVDFLDPLEEDVHMVIREEGANAVKEFNEREAFMAEDTRRHNRRTIHVPLLETADCGTSVLDNIFA